MKCVCADYFLCLFLLHYNFVEYVCTISDFSYLITHTWNDAIVLHEKKKQQTLLQCGPCSYACTYMCEFLFLFFYLCSLLYFPWVIVNYKQREKERQKRESKENNRDRYITMWVTNKKTKTQRVFTVCVRVCLQLHIHRLKSTKQNKKNLKQLPKHTSSLLTLIQCLGRRRRRRRERGRERKNPFTFVHWRFKSWYVVLVKVWK